MLEESTIQVRFLCIICTKIYYSHKIISVNTADQSAHKK